MNDPLDTRDRPPRPVSLLDDLTATVQVAATAEMPADVAALLNPEKGVFIRAKNKPVLDLGVEPVPGASGVWRVVNRTEGQPLLTEIPGVDAEDLTTIAAPAVRRSREALSTEAYCPPWSVEELMPRLVPFRSGNGIYLEPQAIEEGQRLNYPWRTIGIIFNSQGMRGSGVLVGPNLVLTAGHVAPWGQSPWSMEFIPAFRDGPPALWQFVHPELSRLQHPAGSERQGLRHLQALSAARQRDRLDGQQVLRQRGRILPSQLSCFRAIRAISASVPQSNSISASGTSTTTAPVSNSRRSIVPTCRRVGPAGRSGSRRRDRRWSGF